MSWDDPPTQQDQGHDVAHHDQGEGYQQPKSFRSGSVSVPQGVVRNLTYSRQSQALGVVLDLLLTRIWNFAKPL